MVWSEPQEVAKMSPFSRTGVEIGDVPCFPTHHRFSPESTA